MKPIVHIAAKLLTAYFITLPILFGYHTIQHQQDRIDEHSDGIEYAQLAADCELCDLYQSQTATVEVPDFTTSSIHWFSFQPSFTETFIEGSTSLNYLRGPPIVQRISISFVST